MHIDLNCDMGEAADTAHDMALIEHITSANIACGGHAGDESTMARTARLALARGVRIGAHPGYPDREHFGRLAMPLSEAETADTVYRQILRLEAVVSSLGGEVVHVKPHGALYNVAVRNETVARAIGEGVRRWNRSAPVLGLAGSLMLAVWQEMGLLVMAEGFADRRYESDGSLRSRTFADALLTDPAAAAQQAVHLARSGRAETIGVHGDTPGAVEILRACREALDQLSDQGGQTGGSIREERGP